MQRALFVEAAEYSIPLGHVDAEKLNHRLVHGKIPSGILDEMAYDFMLLSNRTMPLETLYEIAP